jgi:hypothetical protein
MPTPYLATLSVAHTKERNAEWQEDSEQRTGEALDGSSSDLVLSARRLHRQYDDYQRNLIAGPFA